ncbi:hypothetical protein [uncultured Tateyamaria sp.]|uniref:hypothetical protein n=1 Tax=uncultured Tateyamaria sp. TaxID=455651 RepID=UPI002602D0ED|nr:hypothetical protein [uncultured Tateyamaria sp.]
MQDPYGAFRRDLVSSLRLSAQAARKLAPVSGPSGQTTQVDPVDYVPLDTSGVGDFPWEWNNLGTFNAETWNFLNTIASKTSRGAIRLTAGFTTWYFNIISATAYLWTDKDQADVNKHLIAARMAQGQLINTYQSMFAPISPADKQTAATALGASTVSNLTYVVDYQIAFRWSGREAAGLPPLTASEIRSGPLASLFAHAPTNAQQTFLPTLKAALGHEQDWARQIDRLWNLSRSIRDAAANTQAPDVANHSGMYTVDRTGNTVVRHSFAVSPPVEDIRSQLSSSATIEVTFSAKRTAKGQTVVNMAGKPAASVPAGVVSVAPNKGAARDLFAHDGSGDRAEVKIIYHGPAEITVAATPFAQADPDTTTGWYFEHPIVQAATNQALNVPRGYHFQIPVGGGHGLGANVGTVQKLLVCRAVTLQVVYPKGDLGRLSKSVPTGSKTSASLMGEVHLKSSAHQSVKTQVQTDQKSGAPSLVLTAGPPGDADTPGPRAHVIGARVTHPFPKIATALQKARPPPPTPHSGAQFGLEGGAVAAPATGGALVALYERAFGDITPAQLAAVQAPDPLAFVLHHVLGLDWSGRGRANKPALTLAEMRGARNLRSLFPEMPLAGAEVLTELHAYLSASNPP